MISEIKMPFECVYCEKEFTSKSILRNHQKTAKYCLKIQEKSDITIEETDLEIENKSYPCKFCNKNFSSKICFQKHLDICVLKLKSIIKELSDNLDKKEKIIEEQKQHMKTIRLEVENSFYKQREERSTNVVEQIAKQPRIQTNNNQKVLITTPMDMSQNSVQQAIHQGFSEEYLIQGQKGAARFAYDNILKDEQGKLKYVCTDPARQIFQYKNEDGSMQKDVRATKLTKALLEGDIKHASHVIACEKMVDGGDKEFNRYTNHYYEIKDLETDNSEFSKELSSLAV